MRQDRAGWRPGPWREQTGSRPHRHCGHVGHEEREPAWRDSLPWGRREAPTIVLALLTDKGHHQDEFPAVQQSDQAAQVVNETIGVWDQEDRSDLQFHLPHLALVFQHSLEEEDT